MHEHTSVCSLMAERFGQIGPSVGAETVGRRRLAGPPPSGARTQRGACSCAQRKGYPLNVLPPLTRSPAEADEMNARKATSATSAVRRSLAILREGAKRAPGCKEKVVIQATQSERCLRAGE